VIDAAHAVDVVDGLRRYYERRIGDPIIEDKLDEPEQGPRLVFPRISDAFVPQSYRVIRQTAKTRRLESEDTWRDAAIRHDLGPFLLSYLSSPYSLETPLVVLGHPGSGKSLLTRVLSATLLSEQFTPLRVPLRELGELPIPDQIERCVAEATGERIDSWARLSSQLRNSPPVIILDGYDELLQISGKVYQSYLKEVRNFQKAEAEHGRPVRVIVTSRLTLIDKATMPEGATIVRLVEFNKDQRNKWISVWNQTNEHYFSTAGIEPFELPAEEDPEGRNVLALAEQPLLLLMLALYDSEDNGLRKSKGIDRTLLYDSLLRRFVRREIRKDKGFDEKDLKEQAVEVDRDMKRLAIAALGMYNRRQLYTLSSELNSDVSFFNLERKKQIESGKPLSQADMLLGSFFFVHKSKALQKGETIALEESSAFEFLHNTFGEFLTADFIVRQALAETQSLADLERSESLRADLQSKLERPDGFSKEWFACLIYTPLFSRPVVLEMLREWVEHSLKRQDRNKREFLDRLDEIILNQIRRILCRQEMPAIMQGTVKTPLGTESTPFAKHPLLGHMSIYSINLITLRTILSPDGYRFAEGGIDTHEDGSRPWDQLTYVWRSWFSLDNLNGLTAILSAERNGNEVTITPRDAFRISTSSSRLETVFNVSSALADNTTSGLAGLLDYNASRPDSKRLDAIQKSVETEGIDLRLQLALKRLLSRHDAPERSFLGYGDDRRSEESVEEILRRAIDAGRGEELYTTLGILCPLREGMARRPIIDRSLSPEMVLALLHRVPRLGISFLRLLVEDGMWLAEGRWPRHSYGEFFEQLLDPRYISDIMERSPEVGADLIELSMRIAGRRWAGRSAEAWRHFLDSSHLRHLVTRRPESFVGMLALFEGSDAGSDLQHLFAEMMDRVKARDLVEVIHRQPTAGIRLIRMLRKVPGKRFAQLGDSDDVDQSFRSHADQIGAKRRWALSV